MPIVTQVIEENAIELDSKQKYNKSLSIFHRFTSRLALVGTLEFKKMSKVFSMLVESSEQNKLDDFIIKHNFDEFDLEKSLISNNSSLNISWDSVETICRSLTSSASKTSTPFKLVACKNPVGRPKGLTQTATSFLAPTLKRKAHTQLKNLRIKRTIIKTVTTTTSTTTTSSDYDGDCTLEGINEINELDFEWL